MAEFASGIDLSAEITSDECEHGNVGEPSTKDVAAEDEIETFFFEPSGHKFELIKSCVWGALNKLLSAVYLCGKPGTGKLAAVRDALSEYRPYVECSAPFTYDGLFRVLSDNRDQCILIRRSDLLYNDPDVVQLILNAIRDTSMWESYITHTFDRVRCGFSFSGSLILVSDRPLTEDRMAQLFIGEEFMLEHDLTDDEMDQAAEEFVCVGNDVSTRDERRAILSAAKRACRRLGRRMNLHDLQKAVKIGSLHRMSFPEDHDLDLLLTSVLGGVRQWV